jgi:hypothetical protein
MKRYSQDEEEKIRAQSAVREWTRSGLLTEQQMEALSAELRTELRRTNNFLRLVLFVFTCLIAGASVALFVDTFDIEEKGPVIATCFVSALLCYGLSEYGISRFRFYRFGIEEGLAAAAVALSVIGSVAAADLRESPILVGLSVGAIGSLYLYLRFGYLYAALASLLCAAAIPFQFNFSLEIERGLTAILLLVAFIVVRRGRLAHGDDYPGDDYGLIQACAAAGVYLSLNCQLIEVHAPGVFYWTTYALVWIIPAVTLWLGLRDRDRPLLDVSLGMVLATLATNKPYLGLMQQSWDPIVFGLFLGGIAIVIRRWLSSGSGGARHGFTSSRLVSGDRRILAAVGTASAALQSDAAVREPAVSKPEFGGGRSGGAGASGEF